VFLRDPIFCLSNQFLLNQCCAPLLVQLANMQTFLEGKQFECIKCKASFKFFFLNIWLLYAFLVLYILSDFPGIKNLNGLNDLNSLISSKKLYFKENMYIFDGLLLFITWKWPLKVKILRKKIFWDVLQIEP
jgi:hypothetical protein